MQTLKKRSSDIDYLTDLFKDLPTRVEEAHASFEQQRSEVQHSHLTEAEKKHQLTELRREHAAELRKLEEESAREAQEAEAELSNLSHTPPLDSLTDSETERASAQLPRSP